MSLFATISEKTNFCVGITIFSLAWVGVASGVGLGLDYIIMHIDHMDFFWFCCIASTLLMPGFMFTQLLLLGLYKPFTLKAFRPLNENIVGEDLIPGITISQLNQTIDALKKFEVKLASLSFVFSTMFLSFFWIVNFVKGHELSFILPQFAIGSVIIMTYTVSSFLYASSKATLIRQKAYYVMNEYKKRKRRQRS